MSKDQQRRRHVKIPMPNHAQLQIVCHGLTQTLEAVLAIHAREIGPARGHEMAQIKSRLCESIKNQPIEGLSPIEEADAITLLLALVEATFDDIDAGPRAPDR